MNICICVIWLMGVRVKVKYAFIITRIYFDYFIFIFIRILFCSFPFKNELYKNDAHICVHPYMCSIHNTTRWLLPHNKLNSFSSLIKFRLDFGWLMTRREMECSYRSSVAWQERTLGAFAISRLIACTSRPGAHGPLSGRIEACSANLTHLT